MTKQFKMVPKNSGMASTSKASTGDDLYHKMHDFVISRTPDQSSSHRCMHSLTRRSLSAISMEIGWNTATCSSLDTLSDIMVRYLMQLAKQTKKYTEHYGRTLVNEDDIVMGFKDMNVSIPELEEYLQNFEPIPIARQCSYFPVPRRTDLNFLRPGSQEVLTRPVHVHEYMPPMILESEEKERESDEENKSPQVVSIKQEHLDEVGLYNGEGNPLNGMVVLEEPMVPEVGSELIVEERVAEIVEVKTEPSPQPVSKVVEEESSDDDIEPASAKAAAVFATFKSTKKLENPSENPALKRVRKVLQEEGHPVREVTSVMMTTSGFLSESREGKTAESRPPAFRDFFDTSPPPPTERKKKQLTMKKILENVKKIDPRRPDEEMEEDGPGLFDVMDKIVTAPAASGASNVIPHVDTEVDPSILGVVGEENGDIVLAKLPVKKLSKQERKLLSPKERKELRAMEKQKKKMKELLKSKSSKSLENAREIAGSSQKDKKNKLTIFTKKIKPGGVSTTLTQKQFDKKRKKEQKKLKMKGLKELKMKGLKELKIPLTPVEVTEPTLFQKPIAAAATEMIDSDEDFSNADAVASSSSSKEGLVVPPVHLVSGGGASAQSSIIPKKKLKMKKEPFKLKPAVFDQKSPKRSPLMKGKQGLTISPTMLPPIPNLTKVKIGAKMQGQKRGLSALMPPHGDELMPPMKKKRGRPKKNWGGEGGAPPPHHHHHQQNLHSGLAGGPGGSVPLPAAQLASIGKSLMIKEPSLKLEPPLKLVKLRKEHMEPVQDFHHPQFTTTKPPTISPKPPPIVSADLLKRLPAGPGLIPEASGLAPPPMRLKELPPSISITPAAISPQKEAMQQAASSSSRNYSGGLPPNVCSSVTITRIDMSHQQKLPSPYDDSITPGIGPPPMLTESPKSRSRMKGVPPPPPLQIPMQTETESGITITPIMMGNKDGGGGGRYGDIPPPPPLQERPQKAEKASMLAKLDEELSSSKEQRKKEKEERKEMKKQKKKKAKDKDKPKDKSEKKRKKKDKSEGSAGEQTTSSSTSASTSAPPVPKITLKLGGHSNTPTPVDSPNPPQIFIDHSDHHPPPQPPPLQPTPKTKIIFKPLMDEKKQPSTVVTQPVREASPDFNVARFSPLVTRPQKPARAAKAHAAAAVAACAMGASNHQEIVTFPASGGRDSQGERGDRGGKRGRPPKGGSVAPPNTAPVTPAASSSSKASKSSVTVLETETVGCIIDDQGNKIWICPACGRQDDGSPMIGCDMCDDWYHFPCVFITQEPTGDWFCARCVKIKDSKGGGKSKKRKEL